MGNKRKYIWLVSALFASYFLLLFALTFFEKQDPNGTIRNLFDALWYSIATFSTVGYGDVTPVSTLGRIIGILFIILAAGTLGLIVGKATELFQKRAEKRRLGMLGTDFENHVIIIGWDIFAENVVNQLIGADKRAAIMTDKKDDIDLIYQKYGHKDVFVYYSDLRNFSSLKSLNIEKATTVFLNNGDDSDKLISILNIKRLSPDTNFVVILDDHELKDTFMNAGVTYVLSKNEIASRLLASYIFEPAVAEFTMDLITSTDNRVEYDIQQYKVVKGNPYAGSDYGTASGDLREKYNIIAIGIKKNSGEIYDLIKLPAPDTKIEIGDYLIVIANGATEKILRDVFRTEEGI